MPAFGGPRLDLEANGPLIRCSVNVSSWFRRVEESFGCPAPEPVIIFALFDTGANVTCVSADVLAKLSIGPSRSGAIRGPTSNDHYPTAIFDIDLNFGQGFVLPNLRVHEIPLRDRPFGALIGRDILRLGVLIYDGPGRHFRFEVT